MAYNREREIADLERQLEENPYNVRALSELARVNAIRADYTAAC